MEQALNSYLTKNKTTKTEKPLDKLVAIYETYKDPKDPNHIDIDGTITYLDDLGIESDDPKALMLAYYLQSPSVGVFNKSSFLSQWQLQKINSLVAMKKFIDKLYEILINNQGNQNISIDGVEVSFENFYNFTFDFLMTNENQKLLDLETAVDYWKLLLPLISTNEQVTTRFNQWYDFIAQECKRAISKDSWSMFYLFIEEIVLKDPLTFKDYDEMAAWPSIIDEYIEYLREHELLQ